MKKIILISMLFAIGLGISPLSAQKSNYIHVSGDMGLVVNTDKDKKFGIGGTIGWLTQDNLISMNPNNYLSLSVKAINNPYGEGKILSSIMNDADDAFNYIMPLAGYRITKHGITNGFFVEPRLGAVFGASYSGLAFSPIAGYTVNQFDFSFYCDMGFGSNKSAMGEKNFFMPGFSVAYNIGIY